jgi:coenzyme F420-reducing hydrogenase gamma subunit
MSDTGKNLLEHPIDRRTFLKAVGAGTAIALFGSRAMMEAAFAATQSIGIVHLGTCNGCQVSLTEFGMDLRTISTVDPTIADLLPSLEIRYAPLLADVLTETFVNDVDHLDVCFVEGIAGATIEATDLLEHIRDISTKVVTVGACASFGGIPSLNTKKGLLDVYPVDKVITVDATIRGCPPMPEHIWYAATGGAIGEPIEAGKLCDVCYKERMGAGGAYGGTGECLENKGCLGKIVGYRCKTAVSTGGYAVCTRRNAPCIGCYGDTFPLPLCESVVSAPGNRDDSNASLTQTRAAGMTKFR